MYLSTGCKSSYFKALSTVKSEVLLIKNLTVSRILRYDSETCFKISLSKCKKGTSKHLSTSKLKHFLNVFEKDAELIVEYNEEYDNLSFNYR